MVRTLGVSGCGEMVRPLITLRSVDWYVVRVTTVSWMCVIPYIDSAWLLSGLTPPDGLVFFCRAKGWFV